MGARVAVLLAVMLVGSTAAFGDLLGPRADEEPAAVDPAQNIMKYSEAAKKHAEEITKKTLDALSAAEAELVRWNMETESLLTNEAGRKIAADPALVAAFRATYEKPRPTEPALAEAKDRADRILKQAYAMEPTELMGKLEVEKKNAEKALAAFVTAREAIESLSKEASLLAPSPDTLEVAIAKQRQEAAAKVAKEEGERIRAAEEAAARRAIDEKVKRIEEAGNRKVLEMKASDATIQARYQPFLARGVFSGKRANNARSWRYNEAWPYAAPISLENITKAGALSNSKIFIDIACGLGAFPNDRPTWPKPRTMEEAQEYASRMEEFRELAPIWREMKLLSK